MIRTLKALILSSVTLVSSLNSHAEETVVFQLGAVNRDGNAVVIESTAGSKAWKTVFNDYLPGCVMNEFTNIPLTNITLAHHHSLSTFHKPLGNNQFAFGCSNGRVFIGTHGKFDFMIVSPSPNLGYLLPHANSPVYLAHSAEFNRRYKKNWLFAAQHGNLFIIDIDKEQLVTVPAWVNSRWGSYLPMGDSREGVDHSKPVTGLDIYQDKEGTFHVLGVMQRNLKKPQSYYSRAILQSLALEGGEPASHWVDIKDEPINAKGDGLVQFGETRYTTSDLLAIHVVGENSSLRGDFSGLNVDPYTRSMVLRGKHHQLVVVRYPVEPVSMAYIGAWGKAVSSKVLDGKEPPLLEDGYPKTFRVTHDFQDHSDLLPASEDKKKRYAHHHMISMKKGIIFSAEADFNGFGQYVYQCDTGLTSGEAWKKGAWIVPRQCNWEKASASYTRPDKLEGLSYPLTGLNYFHSFTTHVVDEKGVVKPNLLDSRDEL
ncbi:hypothetical protein [Endozoicomonas sp. ISHI1]|uniref:hypothetical protein n=1 Tax=Endozoicomonas sp. ISHI1 TaxID=2825882 RepID=UPI0021493872|nr:hypothetical protein [Endozoicomonas sp. ISHI1]